MRQDPQPLVLPAPSALHAASASGVIAYIGMGTNLGDRRGALEMALREMHQPPIVYVERVSLVYETAPVGVTEQPDFLNAVARVRTTLSARALLDVLLNLENKMGRVRTLRWGPRVIDLDLLIYGDAQTSEPGLEVPHPRLRERAFVMAPLAEIAPALCLPPDGETTEKILGELLQKQGTF